MNYITIPGDVKKFFVTFHGTGGNEHSLLWVTGELDPEASIISIFGETGTGKARRYFDPLVEGALPRENFDAKVQAFLEIWEKVKPDGDAEVTFIGYSNGANFILGILERYADIADQVILLHPSNLDYNFVAGSQSRIFVTAGASDTLSIPGETMRLVDQLKQAFPNTRLKLLDSGHEITMEEVQAVKRQLD